MTPPPGSGTSLYVHVPFCTVKCGYCDFNSYVVDQQSTLDRFLNALRGELESVRLPAEPSSVFIGGGTPTLLDARRLEVFLGALGEHVDLRSCPEVTLEANPESVTLEKVELALAAGVDRVSMGAQSFDPVFLRFLDRVHGAGQTRQAFAEVRRAGCRNLSLDLIYGIPGQTLEQWTADLEAALALGPDHLSCYTLTFEPGTRLHRDLRAGRLQPGDDELLRDMFLWTEGRLGVAGFAAYEISNFAGDGGPCRHNDHYWLQGDYVGVGPGAASHRAGVRTTNLKTIGAWAGALERGLPPVASAETLSPWQRAGEALWLGIRRRDGIDLARVGERLELPVADGFAACLEDLAGDGLCSWDGRRVQLTDRGRLFADTVGERFLGSPPSDAHGQALGEHVG